MDQDYILPISTGTKVHSLGSFNDMESLKVALSDYASSLPEKTVRYIEFYPNFSDEDAGFYAEQHGNRIGEMRVKTSGRFTCVFGYHSGILTMMANNNGEWTIDKIALNKDINKQIKTSSAVASSCSDAFTYSSDKALTFVDVNPGSSDSPSLTGHWTVLQTGIGDYGWQIACQTDTNNLYFRRRYSGTWNAWEKLALSNNLGDPSSASSVSGNDAFSKINTLNNNLTALSNKVNDISTKHTIIATDTSSIKNGIINCATQMNTYLDSSYFVDFFIPGVIELYGIVEKSSSAITGALWGWGGGMYHFSHAIDNSLNGVWALTETAL